jgi:nucleoid-associated protein EbfC
MAEEPSMMQMLKQARGLQKQMKQIQKKVDKREVTATAADGKIEIVITGKLQVRRVLIDQSLLVSPNKIQLQDALTSAVNGAIQKAQNLMAVEMQKMAGDMGLPPDAMGEALGADEEDEGPSDDDTTGGGRLRRWFGR